MRVAMLVAVFALVPGFSLPSAASPMTAGANLDAPGAVLRIADNCPPGYHWVPAGYSKKGKYRDARCVANQR